MEHPYRTTVDPSCGQLLATLYVILHPRGYKQRSSDLPGDLHCPQGWSYGKALPGCAGTAVRPWSAILCRQCAEFSPMLTIVCQCVWLCADTVIYKDEPLSMASNDAMILLLFWMWSSSLFYEAWQRPPWKIDIYGKIYGRNRPISGYDLLT